jgi:hypothetical protein
MGTKHSITNRDGLTPGNTELVEGVKLDDPIMLERGTSPLMKLKSVNPNIQVVVNLPTLWDDELKMYKMGNIPSGGTVSVLGSVNIGTMPNVTIGAMPAMTGSVAVTNLPSPLTVNGTVGITAPSGGLQTVNLSRFKTMTAHGNVGPGANGIVVHANSGTLRFGAFSANTLTSYTYIVPALSYAQGVYGMLTKDNTYFLLEGIDTDICIDNNSGSTYVYWFQFTAADLA